MNKKIPIKIAHGRRGEIYKTDHGSTSIATKKARDAQHQGAIQKEIFLLEKLQVNNISFVPQLLESTDDSFSYTRIEGEHFDRVWDDATPAQRSKYVSQLLKHAFDLDCVGVTHGELIRPYSNLLVTADEEIYIIDFERGSLHKPGEGKNLKHIAQRLHRCGYISVSQLKELGTIQTAQEQYTYIKNTIKTAQQSGKFPMNTMLSLGAAVLCVDLLSKYYFYDLQAQSDRAIITPLLNTGISRSIPFPRTITLIASAILIGGLYFLIDKKNKIERLAYALIAGGGIGNLYDRVFYHGVRDFIDFGRRPVFNGADIAIAIGVGALIAVNLGLFNKK